jgi:RHS repeat-associated protein
MDKSQERILAAKVLKRLAVRMLWILIGSGLGAFCYDAIASTPPIELPPAEWLESLPHTIMTAILPRAKPQLPTAGSAAPASSGGVQSNALLSLPAAVGRTAGNFSVSSGGAAVYTIPIWTPPGARGLSPHLALVYSSGTPNDIMGPGWSLAGLSAISRCNQTFAQDGAAGPVTLTSTDVFCLDGNRLRLTGGTYGQAGSTYGTEIETFSQVTAYGTSGNGPSYFIVQGKDGLYYEYGETSNSKAFTSGGTTPYAWLLNEVYDRQGNNLVITYSTASGSIEPTSIQYTQTPATGTSYPYTVAFTYQARVTNLSKFVAGGQIQQTQVLGQINIESAGTSVKTYNLAYTTSATTDRDTLTQIQECSPSDCLPSTQITYQSGTAGIASATTSTGSGATNGTVRSADFDGDGKLDLLFATTSGSNYEWWVQLSTGSGYGAPINTGVVTPASTKILVDDFKGTGQNEILAPSGGYWYVYSLVNGAFTATGTGVPVNTTAASFATADVQGDGLPDLVFITSSGLLYIQTNTSSGGTVSFSAPVSSGTVVGGAGPYVIMGNNDFAASPIKHMDFDGDGRDDLVVEFRYYYFLNGNIVEGEEVGTLLSRGTTFADNPGGWSTSPYIGTVYAVLPVRWNDESCTDLMIFNYVYVMGCNGSPGATLALSGYYVPTVAVDWDGDGRTDLLDIGSNGNWEVQRSLGTAVATPVSTGIAAGNEFEWAVTDEDGDGLDDLVYANPSSSYALSYGVHAGAATPADLATNFSDGFGMYQTPTYRPIAQNNYSKGSGATFPDEDFIGPLYVVAGYTATDGTGNTYNLSYWYYYARLNRQGRGMEGFAARWDTDSRVAIYNLNYFQQDFPLTGALQEAGAYQSSSNDLISLQVPTYQVTTYGSGYEARSFPYVALNTQQDYEVGGSLNGQLITQTSTSTTVDSYGNPTVVTISKTDESTASPFYGEVYTTTTTNTISNNPSTWCLGRPSQTTVQSTTPAGSLTRTTSATVDYTNCRNTQEVIEPSSSTLKVTTNYGFDGCGNINSVAVIGLTSSGATMPTRTTTSNYGTQCTFAESVTNAQSETSSVAYNYSWGLPSSKTDPNGISVSWLYDNYGRKWQEIRPDGTTATFGYTACNASNSYCGVSDLRWSTLEIEAPSGGGQITYSYLFYDGFNRLRYDERLNLAGGTTYNVALYDSLGRKSVQYVPVTTGAWDYQAVTYDLLNRDIGDSWWLAGGTLSRSTSYVYAGRATATTDPKGNVTTRYTDVRGKLRQVVDPSPGGTTSYSYEPFGNLASTTDAIGAGSTATYNLRGFKTASYDPDAGSWSYSPDSLGEVVSQTDAKNQTTTFVFDLVSRLTSRTEAEGTSTWTYGTSASLKNIGKIAAVSGPGYSESRYFDSLGRPSTTMYTVDTTYEVDSAYNATTGFLDNVTYPTSTGGYRLRVQYGYLNGILNKVSDYNAPSTVWWTKNTESARGAPTSETLGNGVNILTAYDDLTGHMDSRTSGTNSGSYNNQQNLSYQWDLNENLTQRTDSNQSGSGCVASGLCEQFSYDALNRLTGSTLNGTSNLALAFDASGNIATKTSIGNYTYDPVKRHAITSTGNGWSFSYDANGNMLTGRGQTITWTSYNKPSSIVNGSISSSFSYTPDRQYFAQNANYSNGYENTIYIGGLLEKVTSATVTDYRHTIRVGSVAINVVRSTGNNSNTYYSTQDPLGSNAVMTNSTGAVVINESFDAYGNRRGSGWTGSPTSGDWTEISVTTRRGYTGHTMLDNVTLVHMNGRVYDPQLGRFLSVDPIVNTIALSQALNPYSYVMNNPLSMIDPSGYSWLSSFFHDIGHFIEKYWRPIVAIVAAIVTFGYLAPAASAFFASAALPAGTITAAGAAFAGGVAGALSSAIMGGSLEQDLMGLGIGALGGFLGAELGGASSASGTTGAGIGMGGTGVIIPGATGAYAASDPVIEEVIVTAQRQPSWWSQMLAYVRSSVAAAGGAAASLGRRVYRAYWDNPTPPLSALEQMRLMQGLPGGMGTVTYGGGSESEFDPPLQSMHSLSTITSGSNQYSYQYWSAQSTDDIVGSLAPDSDEPLLVRPDGMIYDGNTRVLVLQQRGFNVNTLPRVPFIE